MVQNEQMIHLLFSKTPGQIKMTIGVKYDYP
jgi:hypothetical protein